MMVITCYNNQWRNPRWPLLAMSCTPLRRYGGRVMGCGGIGIMSLWSGLSPFRSWRPCVESHVIPGKTPGNHDFLPANTGVPLPLCPSSHLWWLAAHHTRTLFVSIWFYLYLFVCNKYIYTYIYDYICNKYVSMNVYRSWLSIYYR